jgi:DNA-binding SARP family transcriptional activator
MVNTESETQMKLRKLRQAGAAPHWARGLGALLAALLSLSAVGQTAAHADPSDFKLSPNSVQTDVEAYEGDPLAAPADGRIRGYDFAFTVTKAGNVRRVKRLMGWDVAGDGQRLVGFKVRIDRTPEGIDHKVRGALIADGSRIPIYEGDFDFVPGEYGYVASVPAEAKEVQLELSSGGYAQTFSLTQLKRVGPEPTVLYRDGLSPDVVKDNAGERTLRVTQVSTGDKGSLTFVLEHARLSFFTPPEPVGPADDPAKAFLVIEADVFSPDSGEAQFAHTKALPSSALTATLPDGTVVPAQHNGPDDKAYMSGYYYFPVPGDTEAARVTIKPGTFEAYRDGEPGAEPTAVKADGAVVFDIEFVPGAASKLPPLPKGATATTARSPADDTPLAGGEDPVSRSGRGGSPWVPVLLILLLAGAGLVASRRLRSRTPAIGVTAVPAAALQPLTLPAPFVTLAGEGAADAARALILDAAADEHAVVVALDEGPVEAILDRTDVRNVLMPASKAAVTVEVEAACLGAARAAADDDDGASTALRRVVVVVPAGAADVLPPEQARSGVEVRVVAVGGDEAPVVRVEADGSAALPDGTRGLLAVSPPVEQAVDDDEPAAPPDAGTQEDLAEPEPVAPVLNGSGSGSGKTSVEVLGRCRIVVQGNEVRSGLRNKARELLVLLAVRPDGVTQDAALDALFPDVDPAKAAEYLRQAAKNLRRIFRPLEGPDGGVIDRDGPRYQLTDRLPSLDVREFEAAARAAESGDRQAAKRAIALYRGDLAEGWDFPWAEADRERLRLLLLNTISRYAEACRAAGDLAAAESAIDRALAIDRYSEPLYRDLMALHRQQGREDAVRRDYARVEGALAEIGMKPEPRTSALLNGDEPVRP